MKETTFQAGRLTARVFADRALAGAAAADDAAETIRMALARHGAARIILASAPSQNELLAGLAGAAGIDWGRVTVFHLDEYIGLAAVHPASFRAYQERAFLRHVKLGAFYGIRGEAQDPGAECMRYAALLAEKPIDLVCLGIGENGHIAFNDPAVADFSDPLAVKIVELDDACRRQQVNDECFGDLASVPRRAITLTCPAIMAVRRLVCIAPGPRKAAAVEAALSGPISAACPASVLRTHSAATLYLDRASAGQFSRYSGRF